MSQAAVAAAMGVDPSLISKFESGVRGLSLDTADRYARACGHHLAIVPDEP